ncbi:hypothetical protein J437_LFUL019726, partial [Ladona fulva]
DDSLSTAVFHVCGTAEIQKGATKHQARNINFKRLVEPKKNLLILHVQLGPTKSFVEAMGKEGEDFSYLRKIFQDLVVLSYKKEFLLTLKIYK